MFFICSLLLTAAAPAAVAESPLPLLLKTHLKQKTRFGKNIRRLMCFFQGFFLFSSPLKEQKHSCGEFGFPEIPWVLQFLGPLGPSVFSFSWSSGTNSDLTSKQKSRKHDGYHGPGCVPVPFIYLHMEDWVVKIKVFFFCCDMLQRSRSLAFSRTLKGKPGY